MTDNTQHEAAIALMHAARWGEAEALLEQVLAGDARDARALRLLGTVFHLTGRADAATAALEQALTLDPGNTSTLLNLGSVYLRAGDDAQAERCFGQLIAIDPASVDGHFNLGLVAQRTGRLDAAEAHYTRALAGDASAIDAAVNLAAVHLQQGKTASCIDEASAVLASDPTHRQARMLLLRALLASGRLAQADIVLAQTPAGTAATIEMCVLAGKLHAVNGRLDEAASAYREAIARGDDRAQTAIDLARCLLESGESAAAAGVLRALIATHGDEAEHHALLGLALRDAGDAQAALDAYEAALQLEPASAHFLTAKASLQFELGRDEAAQRSIDAAIASAPRLVSPHLLRVERCIATGDTVTALRTCEGYLQGAGAECNMLAAKAFLCHATGRTDEAAALMDYDGLLTSTTVTAPDGYADLDAFNAALVAHILEHPSLSRHNAASKATQHGRQSGNLLFGDRGPFAAFEDLLWREAGRYVRALRRDPVHPFRARAPALDAVYAWAVVLERSGYQTPHIHPSAWLSGVYYPKVPSVVREGNAQQGWIEFGAPPPELALSPALPTRRIKPGEGLLVLFPSYFYHRTVPYDSDEARISIAFDFAAHPRHSPVPARKI